MTTTAIIPATLADAANLTKSGQFAYLKRHESKDGTVSNRLVHRRHRSHRGGPDREAPRQVLRRRHDEQGVGRADRVVAEEP